MVTTLVFCTCCIVGTDRCVSTKNMSHSCCSSTVSARLESCELGSASLLIDLLLDVRIRFLHGVLDDLELFPSSLCGRRAGRVSVHNLFNGSLLDLVSRYSTFDWSLRVQDLLCDFRNTGGLLLLITESEESRSV